MSDFDNGLVGSTVMLTDKKLLEFFYPDFQMKSTLFFDKENKVIYTGKIVKNIKQYLNDNTYQFINTTGVADIDLDVRENMINFVYSRWNKKPNNKMLELIENLEDMDYINFIKTYWVSGKSTIEKSDVTIFELYKQLGKNKMELLRVYYSLLDFYEVEIIESSIITFLEKAMNLENIEVSPYYMLILKGFADKNKVKVGSALRKYNLLDTDKRLKVMWLLLQF